MADSPGQKSEGLFGSMPFLDHLEELRRRLIRVVFVVIAGAGAAFYFAKEIMIGIKHPLGGTPLYNIEVTGTFYAYTKIAIFAGVFIALPYLFYQLWAFVSPGLYRHERTMILPLVFSSTILFLVGAGFCFFFVLPLAIEFLVGFSGGEVINTITISSYISFVAMLLLAFGASFQLPIVAYFLGRMGIVSAAFLSKGRRYAVVIILIVAGIITPPDVFSQVLMSGPLYLLYEISILIVRRTELIRARKAALAATEEVSGEV